MLHPFHNCALCTMILHRTMAQWVQPYILFQITSVQNKTVLWHKFLKYYKKCYCRSGVALYPRGLRLFPICNLRPPSFILHGVFTGYLLCPGDIQGKLLGHTRHHLHNVITTNRYQKIVSSRCFSVTHCMKYCFNTINYVKIMLLTNLALNSLRLRERHQPRPSLVQIMACRLASRSHYLNQWWNIVDWTLGNKSQWNLDRNL